MAAAPMNAYLAIDPVALVLHGRALDIYYMLKHPNTPPTLAELQAALKGASVEEVRATAARAKAMAEVAATALKAAEAVAR
jgi:hypothetical protein